jgi:lysophospholipase L1-like esterase
VSVAARPGDIRLLALGDSYTIGEGVSPDARWPVRLAELLHSAGFRVNTPTIVARTGWTTAELSAGIDAASPASDFDLVTLLVGVNDQYRGLAGAEYRADFHVLIRRAIGFAGGRAGCVVVLSIPDWSVTTFADGRDRAQIAAEIDAFNEINYREAQRAGAAYLDITTSSRRAAADASLIADDGLHPSAAMYEEWARLLLPLSQTALS